MIGIKYHYDSVTEYNTFTMKVMSLISVLNTYKNGSKQQNLHSFETKIAPVFKCYEFIFFSVSYAWVNIDYADIIMNPRCCVVC